MELPICECATQWPGQGHHPECPVRREIERLRAALAAATDRAEAERRRADGFDHALEGIRRSVLALVPLSCHKLDTAAMVYELTKLHRVAVASNDALANAVRERDVAIARANALAARLAEVDGEHPA